jgi:hypothetical protein
MSFIQKGKDAEKALTQEKQEKALVSFKSGQSYRVRVPSLYTFASYKSHSVYKVFYTTPCAKLGGQPCAYCQAADKLYKEAEALEKAGKKQAADDKRNEAYQIKAKDRVMFGFFDLETGKPIILDMTKKQGQTLYSAIKKQEKRLDKFAFEVAKEGEGTNATVTLTLLMEEDLKGNEAKHFEATAGKEFDESLFEGVFALKDYAEQLEDVRKYGVDLDGKGSAPAAPANDDDVTPAGEPSDDDLPF